MINEHSFEGDASLIENATVTSKSDGGDIEKPAILQESHEENTSSGPCNGRRDSRKSLVADKSHDACHSTSWTPSTSPMTYLLQQLRAASKDYSPHTFPSLQDDDTAILEDRHTLLIRDEPHSHDYDAVVCVLENHDMETLRRWNEKGLLKPELYEAHGPGETILFMECERARETTSMQVVQYLVEEANTKTWICDANGKTPLHCLMRQSDLDTVFPLARYLLEKDHNMLFRADATGYAPLDYVEKDLWKAWIHFLRHGNGDICSLMPTNRAFLTRMKARRNNDDTNILSRKGRFEDTNFIVQNLDGILDDFDKSKRFPRKLKKTKSTRRKKQRDKLLDTSSVGTLSDDGASRDGYEDDFDDDAAASSPKLADAAVVSKDGGKEDMSNDQRFPSLGLLLESLEKANASALLDTIPIYRKDHEHRPSNLSCQSSSSFIRNDLESSSILQAQEETLAEAMKEVDAARQALASAKERVKQQRARYSNLNEPCGQLEDQWSSQKVLGTELTVSLEMRMIEQAVQEAQEQQYAERWWHLEGTP